MASITKDRAERLLSERVRTEEKRQDILALAEADDGRELNEQESALVEQYRSRVTEIDDELEKLAGDLEREHTTQRVSAIIRVRESGGEGGGDDNGDGDDEGSERAPQTFARYARDLILTRYPNIASLAGDGDHVRSQEIVRRASARLERALENTTSGDVEGLLPPQHINQIMDIINTSRPIVSSALRVDLSRGKLTYPVISQRPEVLEQQTEKTEAGTAGLVVDMEDLTAKTFLGAGNISWQAINWSTPDVLALWFNLQADEYAHATETEAGSQLGTATIGTASPALGTAGTEDFAAWRASVIGAIGGIYSGTGGRARTNILYLSPTRFFQLAGLGTGDTLQMSAVGNLDIAAMTGTFSGLRVVGSYGLSGNTAIVGDSAALLVGETPGAPVELRAVEPAIGGMEVGVIGAFAAKVFDPDRFKKLS